MSISVIGNDKSNKLLYKSDNKYYDDSFKPSLDNKNESRSIICQNIKEKSIVLDIGCSQGLIGELLFKEKKCKIYGIEIDEEAAQIAKKSSYYESVLTLNIENDFDLIYKKYSKESLSFDYIIFSDVLEHLLYPSETLYNFGKLLKKNGKILVSIPNVSHCDISTGLLNERFNYSAMGILDNTHIRFFTKYSFAEYINEANKIYDISYDLKLINQTFITPDYMSDYEEINKILLENKSNFALQNIFELSISNKTPNLNDMINEKHLDSMKKINDTIKNSNKMLTELTSNYANAKDDYCELRYNYDYIYNEYQKIVHSRSWKLTKPIRNINKICKLIKERNEYFVGKNQVVLLFVHSWVNVYAKDDTNIGGTTLHVLDLINGMKSNKKFFAISVINNHYVLVDINENSQKIYDLGIKVKTTHFDKYDFEFYKMVTDIINNLRVDLIHIHHIMNFPCDLEMIAKLRKTVVTIHDYTFLCPRCFLINNNSEYCKNICISNCEKCTKGIDYITRTNTVKLLLKYANSIIVPDESVNNLIQKYYKVDNAITINHGININNFEPYQISPKKANQKNVAFIGIIDDKKGAQILNKISKKASNIKYHLFGWSTIEDLNHSSDNYEYHGLYKKHELPRLLNENHIDLVCLLSLCPETFSYVLSEVMFAQIPTMAFDIGAIANRIKKHNVGKIIPYGAGVEEIENSINEYFEKKEYVLYKKNLMKTKTQTVDEMVKQVEKIYNDGYIPYNKNSKKIYEYLRNYYLKYIIK